MSFSDPQSITVDGDAKSMARISSNDSRSIYLSSDGEYKFTISHMTAGNRKRRMVRVDRTVIAEDPLLAVNASQSLGVYVVLDEPSFGFSDGDIEDLILGFSVWISTTANIAKLCSEQH
jgi:hypothetical protein